MENAKHIVEALSWVDMNESLRASPRMPILFLGHGNPMHAITDNPWKENWQRIGAALPRPNAILVVSAHWMSRGVHFVNVSQSPPTIHDFGGFPRALHEAEYPAQGAPDIARDVAMMLKDHHGEETEEWGLDHGAWSVLMGLFPEADVPVFQMSIDMSLPFAKQQEIGRQLKALRERGVLVIGSGNLVHNLGAMRFDGSEYDWAVEFDEKMRDWIEGRDFSALAKARELGALYNLAHPTADHLIPAQYLAGLVDPRDELHFFNEGIDLGSASMRSYLFA